MPDLSGAPALGAINVSPSWCFDKDGSSQAPDTWERDRFQACAWGENESDTYDVINGDSILTGRLFFTDFVYDVYTGTRQQWQQLMDFVATGAEGKDLDAVGHTISSVGELTKCQPDCAVQSTDFPTQSFEVGEWATAKWVMTGTLSSGNRGTGQLFAAYLAALPTAVPARPDGQYSTEVRCDADPGPQQQPEGCVIADAPLVLQYSRDINDSQERGFPELAEHIAEAQDGKGSPGALVPGAHLPGAPGGAPLHRLTDKTESKKNRDTACPKAWSAVNKTADGQSCDEYPFKSTYEGAYTGVVATDPDKVGTAGFSHRMINAQDNTGGGRLLGTFYRENRVLDNDAFYVEIIGTCQGTCNDETVQPGNALTSLDLSSANRRAPVSGLYDWSKAGYRAGAGLPTTSDYSSSDECTITADQMVVVYGVIPGDGLDDTTGIQDAIDHIKSYCSPSAGYSSLSRITLPAGELDVSRQIYVDANYLVLSGSGSDPGTGTKLVFTPDANTRYDTILADGSNWDKDAMTSGDASGGWIWPGRGLFRVQSRDVQADYAAQYAAAPTNRKDLFEGTVNVHWKVGAKLRVKPGDTGFAARTGDTKIYIANNTSSKIMANLKAGGYVNVRAANTLNFYHQMQALPTDNPLQDLAMRQQIFTITSVSTTSTDKWITIDKPLEYDVPVDSTSDGSALVNPCSPVPTTGCSDTPYPSKVSPLVEPVLGVGIENLYLTQNEPDLDPDDANFNYGNMDPAGEMNGIVFKWAVNDWVRGVRTEMTGSHPIATEEAKNLTITDNYFDGAWNKGAGGNGYLRGSRVWDSVYAGNTSRNLRHFTFQWSSSGNVAIGNSFDSDINLHGGWERNNLIELNQVVVPYLHRSDSCTSNCGDEGNTAPDESDWFPIWWAAGKKAVKWSGSSGPGNVFFDNTLEKQLGGIHQPYTTYYPYANPSTIYVFGVDAAGAWHHLDIGGTPIADWAFNEWADYTGGHGVDATRSDPGASLFLTNTS